MFIALISFHLFLCLVLIFLVLLQQGKGADVGAAFGGGSNSLFGASGATSLVIRITTGVAIAFMATSIFLINGYAKLADASEATSVAVAELPSPFKGAGVGPVDSGVAAPESAPVAEPSQK